MPNIFVMVCVNCIERESEKIRSRQTRLALTFDTEFERKALFPILSQEKTKQKLIS